MEPHVEGEYDYATGNPHTNPFRIGTYDQQYPATTRFRSRRPLRLSEYQAGPPKCITRTEGELLLLFQAESLHVASIRDGIYASAGSSLFKAPPGGFLHDGIGSGFDASAKYIYHKSFVTNIGVGHFFPGYVMTSTGHGAPLTLAYLQFTYRFRVDH
jgi:hypothetical protein